jgi:hypothetical protein
MRGVMVSVEDPGVFRGMGMHGTGERLIIFLSSCRRGGRPRITRGSGVNGTTAGHQ